MTNERTQMHNNVGKRNKHTRDSIEIEFFVNSTSQSKGE